MHSRPTAQGHKARSSLVSAFILVGLIAVLAAAVFASFLVLNRPGGISHVSTDQDINSIAVRDVDSESSSSTGKLGEGSSHDIVITDDEATGFNDTDLNQNRLTHGNQPADDPRELYDDRETSDLLRMVLSIHLGHAEGLSYIQGLADREEAEHGLDLSEMARLMAILESFDGKGVFSSGAAEDLRNIRCTPSICQFSVLLEDFDQTPLSTAWHEGEVIGGPDFPMLYGKRDVENRDIWHIFLTRPPIGQYRDEILDKMNQTVSGN